MVKSILYIMPKIEIITGGVKVNEQIYQEILKMHDVNIVIRDDEYFWKEQPRFIDNLPSFVKSFLFNFRYIKFKQEFNKYEYIFVDSRMYPRLFLFLHNLKKNSDIKIITTHHHFCFLQQQNRIKRLLHQIVELNFLKNTDKILIFSKYTHDTAKTIGISEKKLSLVELGIDKININEINNMSSTKELLFIGTVEPRKGLEYLIEAIEHIKDRHSDIKVNIVGKYYSDSKYYKKLLNMINKYNLEENILFRGRLGDAEVEKLKRRSYIFVFPSLYEGFGMVMPECMLYGLPVITFDNSAMPYIVKDGYNGLLVRNKDSLDFSNKIDLLLRDQNLRQILSEGAIRTTASFNQTSDFLSGIKATLSKYIHENR